VYRAFPHVRLYLAHTSRPFPIVRLGPLVALPSESSSLPELVMIGALARS
jgi:hypothetical protein